VLIVDQRGALRDHLAKLLGARKRAIEWTDSAPTALRLCEETPVALVIINTSMPGIDPYGLCARIKDAPDGARIAVVLLVGPNCPYDPVRGKAAGVRGLLDKPVGDRHLLGAVKRLLSLPH
jgi:CheY-like chemotaxis protein